MTLTSYIKAAMSEAQFESLPDGTVYGHIPGFEGVWATSTTEAACRRELQEVLEDWMLFRLKQGLPLPVVARMDLNRIAA
jgi:predicted RNase H-like HicB family nuclease